MGYVVTTRYNLTLIVLSLLLPYKAELGNDNYCGINQIIDET
jgi:hypothetical protein